MSPKKRTPLKVNKGSETPEASREEVLAAIRNDTPATTRALSALQPHPSPSRSLDPKHVVSLAHSIAALGLIHPLVVDVVNTLIAGSHRYAALTLIATPPAERWAHLVRLCGLGEAVAPKLTLSLQEGLETVAVNPEPVDFDRIPVRILPLSHADNPEDAWKAEVAENERRRDYSRGEVRELAERLRSRGYKFGKGRPTDGARPAIPVLSAVIGKSERQIQRLLQAPKDEPEENTTDVVFSSETKKLLKYLNKYRMDVAASLSDREVKLLDQVREHFERRLRP